MKEYDYILVGGGLQNGLLALALNRTRPGSRVVLIESEGRLGGNHTWCFHGADVPPGAAAVIAPLTVATWPGYETRFGDCRRTTASRYSAITSEKFRNVVADVFAARGWDLRLGTAATEVSAGAATLESGERLAGRCVIDSRGLRPTPGGCGFQKFLGWEVEAEGWPDRIPVVMDAAVPQDDGFHFVYTVPLAADRVLVEDTYFSDGPELDRDTARERIDRYLRDRVRNWTVVREESGVLPMPWRPGPPRRVDAEPLQGGYGGGWFHPATGYSFPVALRFALAVSSVSPDEAPRAADALARRLAPRWRFARFLNFLLFRFVPPESRWQLFARLYRTLPPGVLARFYALEFTAADAARILVGRPPRIDLLRALRLTGRKPWLLRSL